MATATVPCTFTVAPNPAPAPGTNAQFLGYDYGTLMGMTFGTQGNWKGVYGRDGGVVVPYPVNYPAYAQVNVTGQQINTWTASTTDVRALLQPTSTTDRVAGAIYGSQMVVDVKLTDGLTHQVAFYCLDWDGAGMDPIYNRTQRIDVVDPATGTFFDSQTVSDFVNGKYVVYNVSGHVQFRVSVVGGRNAVVSGIFFDPAGKPVPPVYPTQPTVTATADKITLWCMDCDPIPNFGGRPTLTAAQSGNWSNAATWGGRLPVAGETVSVPAGLTVVYDQVSDLKYTTVAVQPGGMLRFRTDVSTRLRVTNLLVMEGGALEIGTAATPVAAGVTTEIVVNDVAIDTTKDPSQYGNGVIAFGKVTIYGQTKTPFVRLAIAPKVGDTTITLSVPAVGWAVGDKVLVPETRQLTEYERWGSYTSQNEVVTVTGVSADNLTVTFTPALQFDHPAAVDPAGVVRYVCHAGNLTRNVVFYSENPTGTRGHVMFTLRADADVRYCEFRDLGRSTIAADDDTTYDSMGNVTHLGTNPKGRYSFHFHHVYGTRGGNLDGYQFRAVGNSSWAQVNPMKYRWGMVIHMTCHGLVSDNVVYNWAGAGMVGETGAEHFNAINHNLVAGIVGNSNPRWNDGRDGSTYWFHGWNNYFMDNAAAGSSGMCQGIVAGSGFNLMWPAASKANTPVPLFPGANLDNPAEVQYIDMQLTPILEFSGNEAYGAMATGLALWELGTDGYGFKPIAPSTVKDFAAWHCWEEGFYGYPINKVIFDGYTVIGHPRCLVQDSGGRAWTSGDYFDGNVLIKNADIQGTWDGITGSCGAQGLFTVKDSKFRVYGTAVSVDMLAAPGARGPLGPRINTFDNLTFEPYPNSPYYTTIEARYNPLMGGKNYIQSDKIYVYNYNGVAGDNFQVFYKEQAPDFIVPQTTYYGPDNNGDGIPDWVDSRGSPEAGLTNAQNWAKYSIAIAGQVSPTSDTRPNVNGFVLQAALPAIATMTDNIPDFGTGPDETAVQSGNWSDPATWGGVVPAADDVVSIPPGINVTLDQVNDVKHQAVKVAGTLQAAPAVNTRLRTTHLLIVPGGTVTLGTPAAPVAAGVTAEVVINDVLLDTALDPSQYGNGLLCLGTIKTCGQAKTAFARVAAEPKAGDTAVTFSAPVAGWAAGDLLIFPDTQQLGSMNRWTAYISRSETATVAAVSANGLTVTLATPLQFDHLGGREPDGTLTYLPHVGNLTRNVIIRSENPAGTRGHTLFTGRADVDLRFTQFSGLGRSKNGADDDTTYDAAGNVTHVGTNPKGRYPVHFHHLMGPAGGRPAGQPLATGTPSQFSMTGCSVFCPVNQMVFRWGITVHASNYGLVDNNVLYNWAGAGLMTETGEESYNQISNNLSAAITGDGNPRSQSTFGREGSGFWFMGWNNHVVNNVSAAAVGRYQEIVSGVGFKYFWLPDWATNVRVPLAPGADMSDPTQYKLVDMKLTPILENSGNEAYGASATGLTIWELGTTGYDDKPVAPSTIKDFVSWHCWEEGVFLYPVNNLTFDGLDVLGDVHNLTQNSGGGAFTSGDYRAKDVTVQNARIRGTYTGFSSGSNTQGTFTVRNMSLQCFTNNLVVTLLSTPGTRAPTGPRKIVIDNVGYAPHPGQPAYVQIDMQYPGPDRPNGNNYIQSDQVYVTNHNRVAGDNFQLFYTQQAPDFIVPQTTYYGDPPMVNSQGAPVAGLTNTQAWAQYGIAIAGAVSPTSATRPNINGFVQPTA